MLKKLFASVMLALLVAVAGCAALEENERSAKLATMYATIKVTDGDPEKADRVAEIATEVRAYASGEKLLTVDLLIDRIKKEVRWDKLDAADELLVHALLDELRLQLEKRLGKDILPEDLRLAADKVAGWVIDASAMR